MDSKNKEKAEKAAVSRLKNRGATAFSISCCRYAKNIIYCQNNNYYVQYYLQHRKDGEAMRRNRLLATVTAAALVVSLLTGGTASQENAKLAQAASYDSISEDIAVFDNYNASEITDNMGAGWNLGNQLESIVSGNHGETLWGNPAITQGTLDMVKNAGFKTVRIPVSYINKIGSAPNYTIDSAWLARIKEVVDYAMNAGLYVIINMHGDGYNTIEGGWLLCNAPQDQQDAIKAKYKACWQQIADCFKGYDEHLIFESMNEEFDGQTYGAPVNKTYYTNINAYNQIFVDTVRQSGGNNDKRWLLMPGWNTNIELTTGNYGFAIPTDTYLSKDVPAGENRIMISVHYYDSYNFTHEPVKTGTTQWGDNATDISKTDGWSGKSYMQSEFVKLQNRFTSKGYPVVIGEYGATDCSGADSNNLACRKDYYKTICEYSVKYGCVPVAWDTGGIETTGDHQFGLFDRHSLMQSQNGAEIIEAIMSAYSPEAARAAAVARANEVIKAAESYKEEDYTKETWEVFAKALEAAKAAVANAEAGAPQIKEAAAKLQEAISGLNKKPDEEKTPISGEDPTPGKNPEETPVIQDTPAPGGAAGGTTAVTAVPEVTPTPDVEVDDTDSDVAKVELKKVSSLKKATVKITWKKLSGVSGYEVKLGTNKKLTKAVKKVTVKKSGAAKVTVKKLKRKKTYYVKVRAYVINDSEKVYGAWSKAKKTKVK